MFSHEIKQCVILVFRICTVDGRSSTIMHECDYSVVKAIVRWLQSLCPPFLPKITMEWGKHNGFSSNINPDECREWLDTRIKIDLTESKDTPSFVYKELIYRHDKAPKTIFSQHQLGDFMGCIQTLVQSIQLEQIIMYIPPARFKETESGEIQLTYYKNVEEFIKNHEDKM